MVLSSYLLWSVVRRHSLSRHGRECKEQQVQIVSNDSKGLAIK